MTTTSPLKSRLRRAFFAAALLLPLPALADGGPVPGFDPASARTFAGAVLAGQIAAGQSDLDTAIAYFRRALQYSPDDVGANDQLFIALVFNSDLQGAAAQADKTSDNPQLVSLRNIALGLSALSSGDYDDAITRFDTFGGSDLDQLVAELLKAWAQVGKGDTDAALETIDALEGPPWYNLFANDNAGAIALIAGDTERARTYLNNALSDRQGGVAAPDTMLRTVIALAGLEQKAGNTRKALDTISVAETYGLNDAVLDPLRAAVEAGEPIDGAPETATEGAAGVLFEIAAALNQGGPDEVVALYLALASALAPNEPDILYSLGTVAAANKKPEQALAYFARVPEGSPQFHLAELQQGLLLADLGQPDEAREHLESLVEAMPDDRRAYLALAAILSGEKQFQEMADVLDKAVDVIGPVPKPEDWSIFYRRGIAYERLKEWDKAEPNFFKALDLYPDQPQVLNYLGYSWIDQGINLEDGLDLIKQAVDQRPDDGYIVDSLGWAYYRLGRYDDAVTELERAVELDTADPTINDHLGDAYWQVGRKLEAIYQWNKALASEPEADLVPGIRDKLANGLTAENQKDDATPVAKAAEGDGDAVKTP
ncbi:tetratricopeptide repeat protein [Martelella endophytica]|uniref:tetratricopeptide repeat protein n=1 Tax=Martelella endophytica TaxID=1486262 RepID=UPI000AB10006|nr:tetratricopeptide repeat protein [Martelella endophytica]